MSYISIVIKHRSCNKFLCWNSYKSVWYWGPKHLSEKFWLGSKRMERLLSDFKEGTEYWCKETEDDATCVLGR